MTLKELLDEQGRKFDETFGALKFNQDFGSGASDGRMAGCDDCEKNQTLRKEHRDFLRQNTIDTVKWVMEMIEVKRRKLVTQPAKYKGYDANVWREGKNTTIDDILSELNKSIEDHERKS